MKRLSSIILALAMLALASLSALAAGVSVDNNTTDMRARTLFKAVGQTLDTRTFSFANAAMYATNKMDLQWGNAIVYAIDNVAYTKAAGNFDISTLGTFDAQSALKARLYVFTLDASGNVGLVSGAIVASTADPAWPEVPTGKCPFAAVKVATATATTFTIGTTAFDAAGITATWYNLSQLPSRALDE